MVLFFKKIFFKFSFNFNQNCYFMNKFFLNNNNFNYYLINFNYNSFFFFKNKFNFFFNYFQSLILRFSIFYFLKVTLIGLGFKIFKYKKKIIFKLGFSHYLFVNIPKDLNVFFKKSSFFILSSFNKKLLVNFVSKLYKLKDFNFYKGKGFSLLNLSDIPLQIRKQKQS